MYLFCSALKLLHKSAKRYRSVGIFQSVKQSHYPIRIGFAEANIDYFTDLVVATSRVNGLVLSSDSGDDQIIRNDFNGLRHFYSFT